MASDALLPPVLLVGAGKMGGALFRAWCARGLAASAIVDPAQPVGLARAGDIVVGELGKLPDGFAPSAVIVAVKPQGAEAVLPELARFAPAVVVSIMAGRTLEGLAAALGPGAAVVRAMPNTPAAIGQGMSVACAGAGVSAAQRDLAEALLRAAGEFAWVEEAMLDAATPISGSGPAYVFLLAEMLEQVGVDQGLPPALARQLARQTVIGSALLLAGGEDAAALRVAVTSPGGTTEQALRILMAEWPSSLSRAVEAAIAKTRSLATK